MLELVKSIKNKILECILKKISSIFLTKQEKEVAMKNGIKTSEFWLSIVSIILGIIKQRWLPDFPVEAFYTVIVYILSRTVLKAVAAAKSGNEGGK
jgi:hypothetical protein